MCYKRHYRQYKDKAPHRDCHTDCAEYRSEERYLGNCKLSDDTYRKSKDHDLVIQMVEFEQ